ncbi:unnamed protein product, partial [Echinostoma caproni]|uniref:Large ribosomal subunit protein uL15m n=1 Tax=Echinostoma caproni TaxID=27848 RepID=A0A183B1J5_9TREM
YPAEIVGKRTQVRVDGSTIIKCHLDVAQRNYIEHKLKTITGLYKKLTGKDVQIEFPEIRRSFARISLLELQRLIDLHRIDPNEPIDLTTICNTGLYFLDVEHNRQYGFQLTEDGVDNFVTPINIEVQHASEPVIAAIERVGGVITTRFYDLFSIWAKKDPLSFFQQGIPIPSCKLPPTDAIPYYTSAESRGYLADPQEIDNARAWLAQKYGYRLITPKINPDHPLKDPRQIFFGLTPGSLVSLVDKVVLKPKPTDAEANASS